MGKLALRECSVAQARIKILIVIPSEAIRNPKVVLGRARLQRLRKNSNSHRFWEGHEFHSCRKWLSFPRRHHITESMWKVNVPRRPAVWLVPARKSSERQRRNPYSLPRR